MATPLLKASFILAIAFTACDHDSVPTSVVPADVSFLVPLTLGPTRVTTESAGGHGALLPRVHFDAVSATEPLTLVDEPDDLYTNLTVVAVRLDPCFVEGLDDSPCASQIRLVFQPVIGLPTAPTAPIATTRDASLHAFYAVPRDELDDLAAALAGLRTHLDGPTSVGVHIAPDDAMRLVLAYIGADRLTRITHMSVHASNEAWVFGGFDLVAGQRIDIPIPGATESHDNPHGPDDGARFRFEQHLTSTGATSDLSATLIPEPTIEADIAPFLDAKRRRDLSADGRDRSLAALQRLIDPKRHDPGTVDCASCHIATTALRFATRDSDPDFIDSAYDDTRNQRMFGWFGDAPSIARRVLLETDAVVEYLNRLD